MAENDLIGRSAQLLQLREAYLRSKQDWDAAQLLENQSLAAMNQAKDEYEQARKQFSAALQDGMP